jgi:hypothetical protein
MGAAGASGAASADGVAWLRRAQRGGGGYALATNGVVNAQSSAWAVQGLVAAAGGGKALNRALAYLARLRASDGHYRYSRSSDQTPVWVTAQALLAVERRPFPLAPVARRVVAGGGSADGSSSPSGGAGATAPPSSPGLAGPTVSGGAGGSRPRGEVATGSAGEGAKGSIKGERASGAAAKGSAAEPAFDPDNDTDTAVDVIGDPAAAEPAASSDSESEPVAPYVAAGFGALALALAAGFYWYRRRLP